MKQCRSAWSSTRLYHKQAMKRKKVSLKVLVHLHWQLSSYLWLVSISTFHIAALDVVKLGINSSNISWFVRCCRGLLWNFPLFHQGIQYWIPGLMGGPIPGVGGAAAKPHSAVIDHVTAGEILPQSTGRRIKNKNRLCLALGPFHTMCVSFI